MEITPELRTFIVGVVEERVRELKVSREEFEKLREAVESNSKVIGELSLAIGGLVEAQKKTEERINSLVEAQKKTEDSVAKIARSLEMLGIEVGRLSDTIGFSLEDLARELLPSRLKELGIQVEKLERRYFLIEGEEIEVNLFGEGLWNGQEALILGEVKSRIYRSDIEAFSIRAGKIEKKLGRKAYRLMFGFAVHPSALKEGERLKVSVFAAYGAHGI